jgi:hypothetical protein
MRRFIFHLRDGLAAGILAVAAGDGGPCLRATSALSFRFLPSPLRRPLTTGGKRSIQSEL